MQPQHQMLLGGLAAATLSGLGAWVMQRKATCASRLEQSAFYDDAQVRRNTTGQC
jgi:hypothetical protein